MRERLKLNDVYPNWYASGSSGVNGGFFTQLQIYLSTNNVSVDWLPDAARAYLLDIEYHGNIAGDKPIAPLLTNMLTDNIITSLAAQRIAGLFWSMFGTNITKQYAVLSTQYNPIQNYDMTETATDTENAENANVRTGGKTDTHTGQTKTETDSDANAYGFDSATPVGVDTGHTSTTNTIGLDNIPVTDTTTYNNQTDAQTIDSTREHTLTRTGNIGVTTSQQMLQSEIDLWMWNFYTDYLFPSANLILTLPIY